MNRKITAPTTTGASLTPELLLEVMDEPIVCHRPYVEMTGQVAAALVLTYATHATEKLVGVARNLGWFARTRAEWKHETGLSDVEFQSAKRRLTEVGLLEERTTAALGLQEYRINPQRLYELMQRQANAHWQGRL
jgi:hypothetical protein